MAAIPPQGRLAMPFTRRRDVALLLVLAAGVTGLAYQGLPGSPANRPWPPDVQNVSSESPALSPADALNTFYMPPGYHLELVASEPLVQDPISMDWDADGRLWVVEMPGFVPNLDAPEPNMNPIGRVVVLEDTDGDGRMDKRTVFADGLVLARSVKALDNHQVLVAEPPNVWLMRDTNGDLKMDTKESVTDLYGRREGRVEQNASTLFLGMDNRIYTSDSDIYFESQDGKLVARRTISRGEWGVTQDDAGRTYRNSNESALHVDLVPTTYFARNPNLLRTRGSYEPLDAENPDLNVVWPVRPNPGTNRAYQFGIDRPDGSLARFTSACAPLIYRGDRLPADLAGNAFIAEPAANTVSRLILTEDGTGLHAKKAYERGEFLTSTDERFRPVFLSNAPDGTLYIVDMYRGVIQQRADITQYLHDHIVSRKLEEPTGLGRIYRVVHETTHRDVRPSLSTSTAAQLVAMLSHPNGWWRDTAEQLLVARGARTVADDLRTLATTGSDWRARLQALWTLDGTSQIDPPTLARALEDASRDVRVAAIRISERWLGDANHPIQAAVLERLGDEDWAVEQQLAASLGALPAGPREAAMAAFLEKHADDPIAMDAALSGLRGSEEPVLDALLRSNAGQTSSRETAITMLAATLLRGASDGQAQTLFARIGDDTRAAWTRSDLLRGAEIALAGATLPGTPGRRGAPPPDPNAPCPTCQGGRAGPGGAYFFPQVAAVVTTTGGALGGAPAGGRGGARARLRLNREPVALTALASSGGEFAARATALLTRLEWPGKPDVTAPIAPLTTEEQRRFDAGAEVYKNVCQTCHQPDGHGQERVAANLVGSVLGLAPPEIPIRIVLNGKEGPIGLMPPVGQVFSDEQIADVLTYIRHEWGQDGSAVDVATVKAVRAQTTGRARPWTNDELLALIPNGRGRGH
jgi:mono/diheme cytochrome c family protein/glucose/arabinose dehydrogenase